ncbi:unnamed protein product [Enterobius vermicularis]|uniref:CAP10 domain-containing protein n=1 Tax=Enterobius vermicularis TaxID=51028 RepID=A0A0N4VHK6_ENTVE|nr:unnamed protein product [Enterobius vermicularis]
MVENASRKGTRYQIIDGKIYRDSKCLFVPRCEGVQHYLLQIASTLPNTEFVINFQDFPQVSNKQPALPIFSFSKDGNHNDILYPTWSFWSGGPAIPLYPSGIGKWNQTRQTILRTAESVAWESRKSIGFFRGSRTNINRDKLILLSREKPDFIDARYTKNQAWRSNADTLGEKPAREVLFEDHCRYKYLFNFAGVAASFRHRHILLCGSTVFHVEDRWIEFYYRQLIPWFHYVPVSAELENVEKLISFARNHDNLMETIGRRGQKFIKDHLKEDDVLCYWKLLLQNYTKLLRYVVVKDNSLMKIDKENFDFSL